MASSMRPSASRTTPRGVAEADDVGPEAHRLVDVGEGAGVVAVGAGQGVGRLLCQAARAATPSAEGKTRSSSIRAPRKSERARRQPASETSTAPRASGLARKRRFSGIDLRAGVVASLEGRVRHARQDQEDGRQEEERATDGRQQRQAAVEAGEVDQRGEKDRQVSRRAHVSAREGDGTGSYCIAGRRG
jgi:hypothetical protein